MSAGAESGEQSFRLYHIERVTLVTAVTHETPWRGGRRYSAVGVLVEGVATCEESLGAVKRLAIYIKCIVSHSYVLRANFWIDSPLPHERPFELSLAPPPTFPPLPCQALPLHQHPVAHSPCDEEPPAQAHSSHTRPAFDVDAAHRPRRTGQAEEGEEKEWEEPQEKGGEDEDRSRRGPIGQNEMRVGEDGGGRWLDPRRVGACWRPAG